MGRNRLGSGLRVCAALVFSTLLASPAHANDECPQGNFPVSTQADRWGRAVAMDAGGTHALVGGWDAVGGNGRVRTFVNDGTSWVETATLAPDVSFQAGAAFGFSIAMSADGLTVAIGAPGDRHGGSVPFAGSVYIFVREPGSDRWTKQARLTQPSPGQRFNFGTSVAISDDGNKIAVGQVGNTFFGVVVDSAWTFTRSGTTWSAASEIVPAVNDESEDFGIAIALSADGSVAVVGAPGQLAVGFGAAYVFNAAGASWTQEAKLASAQPLAGSGLGRAVAVAGPQVLIGSPYDSGGALHVHEKVGGAWTRTQTLRLPGVTPFGAFGWAIAVRGDHALVGSPTAQSNVGTVEELRRTNGEWTFANQFGPPSTEVGPGVTAGYGSSVAFSADATEFVIGAPDLASGGTFGVGKAFFPDFVTDAVVFDLEENASTMALGFTLPNGAFFYLSFDVIGQLWALFNKGCDETDKVNSYVITAIDLSTVQNEAVIEWSPDTTLVFTDLHVTLAYAGDAVLPDSTGKGTLKDCGVTFSAILQLGEGESMPMSWTTEISTPLELGSSGGALTLTIPAAYGQIVLDLGLGANNPVAEYWATMLATEGTAPPCPADLDGNGAVGASDLGILLGEWNARVSPADLDQDGAVGPSDLGILLGAWGPCPT
ncbi:MAG: hypothetical protein JNM94_00465 [Phycisphaerae bacterium]|nr:hypothetical protein [Phycisphaerae bacterium]